MPEVSRFYGLVIRMYFNDHAPPHFHVEYGSFEAVFDIRSLAILGGQLPARARGLAVEWASIHAEELLENWERARHLEPLNRIEPLA